MYLKINVLHDITIHPTVIKIIVVNIIIIVHNDHR